MNSYVTIFLDGEYFRAACFGYANPIWRGDDYSLYGKIKNKPIPKDFGFPISLPLDCVEPWLDLLAPLPFEWEYRDPPKGMRSLLYGDEEHPETRKYIWVELQDTKYQTFITIGNLIKGVSEFDWLAQAHLEDPGNEPFFDKNFRVFTNYDGDEKFNYNPNHGWWDTGIRWGEKVKKVKKIERKLQTIEQLRDYLASKDLGIKKIWDQCLSLS